MQPWSINTEKDKEVQVMQHHSKQLDADLPISK